MKIFESISDDIINALTKKYIGQSIHVNDEYFTSTAIYDIVPIKFEFKLNSYTASTDNLPMIAVTDENNNIYTISPYADIRLNSIADKIRINKEQNMGECGKISYKTKIDAEYALVMIQSRAKKCGNDKRQENRVYFCQKCKMFHLTSHEKNTLTWKDLNNARRR